MVYPVFEEKSIAARCLEDIKKFHCICTVKLALPDTDIDNDPGAKKAFKNCLDSLENITSINHTNISTITKNIKINLESDSLVDVSQLTNCINNLKQKIVAILTDETSYSDESHIVDYDKFDYSHHVKYFKLDAQERLWILRTYVFYQLMIFATKIIKSETLFKDIYNIPESKYKRVWRSDVTEAELKNYKMGIFGSLTPTSDIDVGIAYTGFTKLTALSYVVSIVEDMFLIFMGKSSLQLDIEPYADMYVLPNPKTTPEYDSLIFYLDTTGFSQEDNETMLPYVGASILRNYVTAQKDLGKTDTVTIINKFNWTIAFRYFTEKSQDAINFYNSSRPSSNISDGANSDVLMNANEKMVVSEEPWQIDANNMINDYMTKDYEIAREKYYTLVQTAEESIIPIKEKIFPQLQEIEQPDNNIPKDMVINAMQKISHALVFRAESYTCAPTIMHVVRILQVDKQKKAIDPKYETITPEWCDIHVKQINTTPICKIGLYGYLMSMFEQLGYMYRFHLTYCINVNNPHFEQKKCGTKIQKYEERLINAVELYKRKLAQMTKRSRIYKIAGTRTVKKQQPKQTRHKRRGKQGDKRGGKRKTRKSKQ